MKWIRENVFLTVFIAVMVIGVGALGYLAYGAWGAYAEATDDYNSLATTKHQLESRVPYPSAENLQKYQQERDQALDATRALADSLSKMELPPENMSAFEFQNKLRQTVNEVNEDADKAGVKLPAKFALDMDRYLAVPPSEDAAGPLGRQLDTLKLAVEILIDQHVEALVSLKRSTLAQEAAGGPAGANGGGAGGRNGGGGRFGGGGNGGGAVQTYPFEVQFTSGQLVLKSVLNAFAQSDKQFFVTRTLHIQNSNTAPAAKASADAASATPAPTPDTSGTDTSTAAATPAPVNLAFVVGTEKVNVSLRVDTVAFGEPGQGGQLGGGGFGNGRGNGGGGNRGNRGNRRQGGGGN